MGCKAKKYGKPKDLRANPNGKCKHKDQGSGDGSGDGNWNDGKPIVSCKQCWMVRETRKICDMRKSSVCKKGAEAKAMRAAMNKQCGDTKKFCPLQASCVLNNERCSMKTPEKEEKKEE